MKLSELQKKDIASIRDERRCNTNRYILKNLVKYDYEKEIYNKYYNDYYINVF